ncbi:MAG: ABC transporter ATP-binding protein [Bacilli bacterium]
MSEYAIEMLNITKTFGTLVANDNITLQLKKGEIHAILGENGAGKSTLMSILFGLYSADSGLIKINGEEVKIDNPNDANRYGIGMVHQHFKLIEVFSVLENIILGRESTRNGFLDKKTAREKIEQICIKYDLNVDLDALVKNITVGQQQRVEIIKMLYRESDIMIFDEPTAVLTPQEIEGLMQVIRDFSKEGKSIIIITHKLNEIKMIADRCTVLRKGKYIDTIDVATTSIDKMAELMVGHKVSFQVEKEEAKPREVIFEANNLSLFSKSSTKKIINDINFNVRAGEIVCIAGIDGNGQSELIHIITGLKNADEGELKLNNINITNSTIRERFNCGLAHIPEDRHKHGLILDYTLEENLISNTFYKEDFQKRGLLKFKEIRDYANKLIDKYDIRSSRGPTSIAREMSGGNQQKAIIARETNRTHDFLVASQPTRGLDVGAIEYVHKTLINERDKGNGILVVSYELDEVMDLADRILVMFEGQIVAELNPKTTNINEIGLYMSGSKKQELDAV